MTDQYDWFPKDCRDATGTWNISSRTWFYLLILSFIAAVVSLLAGMVLLFPLIIVFLVIPLGCLAFRCPACGSTAASSYSGFCTYCGSKITTLMQSRNGIPVFLPAFPGKTRTKPPSSIRVMESSDSVLRFGFKRHYVLGLFTLSLGFFLWWLLCGTEVIECKRLDNGTVVCQASTKVLGSRFFVKTISNVRSAEVEYNRNRRPLRNMRRSDGVAINSIDEIQYTGRLALITETQRIPLTWYYSSISGATSHENMASELNRFINNSSAKNLILSQAKPFWTPLVPAVFFFLAYLFLLARDDEFILDGQSRRFSILRGRFSGNRRLDYALDIISQFGVMQGHSRNSQTDRMNSGFVYSLGVRLATGAILSLETSASLRRTWRQQAAAFLEEKRVEIVANTVLAPTVTNPLTSSVSNKICMVCLKDCSSEPRCRDEQGRYYHQRCIQKPASLNA